METETKPRIKNQDMSDITEGRPRRLCWECKSLNIVLVKYIDGVKTKNYTTACSNRKCMRFCNLEEMPSWQRTDSSEIIS